MPKSLPSSKPGWRQPPTTQSAKGPWLPDETIVQDGLISNLAPGQYVVMAAVVTTSGATYAPVINGSPASVIGGGTANVDISYAVQTPGTGGLQVGISGLPGGLNGSVNINGPGGFNQTLGSSQILGNLAPGSYIVSAASVSLAGITYTATVSGSPATVTAGQVAMANVIYTQQGVAIGSLTVNITGLSSGLNASLRVVGPGGIFPMVGGKP